MKLKEIPVSVYHTLRLKSLSVERLYSHNRDTIVPVIVSLTSIPSRLNKVHITIRSLLSQTKKPKKIILWLHEEIKNDIPRSLKILEGDFFEIRYSHLTCSHKKLIHTLKYFPEDIIVTCDDDFIYDKYWLELLYKEHLRLPNCIIANQTRYICHNEKNEPLSYKLWKYPKNTNHSQNPVLAIGAGGVLYPPNKLDKTVFDEELFLSLTPKADDLWFKGMSFLNGTQTIQSLNPPKPPTSIAGTQKISLKKQNIGKDLNRVQWEQLTSYFKIDINEERNSTSTGSS
ncbi:glycosyltransferase [Zhouia spongiae]|uniref:Glycosyltransferase n=1 Tax=Zhouia spongiae TaxID=2202721 RepID=A0ABY3YIY7_9FLAO|nr:glycosyltransferase [Zhouia spongiae]UNY97569.1 glycosyltransferase [Zhouia spongiae]